MQREKSIGEWWIRGEEAFNNKEMLKIIYLAETANSGQTIAKSKDFSGDERKIIHSAMRLLLGINKGEGNVFNGTHPDFDFKEHNLEWLKCGFEKVIIDGVKRLKPNKKNLIFVILLAENNKTNSTAQKSEGKKEGE